MPNHSQTELPTTSTAATPLPIIDPPPPPVPASSPSPAGDDRPPPSDPDQPPAGTSPNAPPPTAEVKAETKTDGGEAKLVRPVTPMVPMGFEPTNWDEMWRYAKWLAATSFVPEVVQGRVNDVMFMLMKGKTLGLTVMQSAALYVIDGKICMPAETMLSIILKSPMCKYMRPTASTMERAEWTTLRRGDEQVPVTMDYTLEEAREMGLLDKGKTDYAKANNPWKKQRRNMLRWRGVTTIGRVVYPDVIGGFYSHEEVVDMIELRNGEVVIEPLTKSTVTEAKDGAAPPAISLVLPATTATTEEVAMREAIDRSQERQERQPEPVRRAPTTVSRVAEKAAAARTKDPRQDEPPICPTCQGPVAKPGLCESCKRS